MITLDKIELKNIDPEDFSDVLAKIEKSFGFQFGKSELAKTMTFGELCDIICSRVELEHSDDCTTQQAFYKIRQSIANIQLLKKDAISPDSNIEIILPREGRRQKVIQVSKELGFPLKILQPKEWVSIMLFLIPLGSFVELFINWKFGLIGLLLSITSISVANRLGKEFTIKTVGELADKMARENYIKSRRNPKTANRLEIVEKIKELFCLDLDLDPSVLTKEAALF
jgi:hypothetical protein